MTRTEALLYNSTASEPTRPEAVSTQLVLRAAQEPKSSPILPCSVRLSKSYLVTFLKELQNDATSSLEEDGIEILSKVEFDQPLAKFGVYSSFIIDIEI